MSIRKGTTIIAGNSSPLDWTGTLQEYNIALENGTIKPDMVCYITDDTLYTDDIRPEIETLNNIKANKDLSNLSEVGEKHFLNKSQITNCITEVPQRVKVELIDGVFTLKAGSQVIVPNGFEADGVTLKFDYVTIQKDRTYTATTESTAFHFYSVENDYIRRRTVSRCYSGNTEPTSSTDDDIWYDTGSNIVKRKISGVWVDNLKFSLPFATATDNGTIYSSIDQVFNGFGYIGSTVWADKGIKFLCPNGRNADGTLNNIERVTKRIDLDTLLSVDRFYTVTETSLSRRVPTSTFIQEDTPNLPMADSSHAIWFKPSTNTTYYASVDATSWTKVNNFAIVGSASLSRFDFKQPFRAVDYNNKQEVSGWGMPSNKYIDLTLGANGTNYIAPANGWFVLRVLGLTGSTSMIRLQNNTNGIGSYCTSPSTGSATAGVTVPALKGNVITLGLFGTYTEVQVFRFIYAEGEV